MSIHGRVRGGVGCVLLLAVAGCDRPAKPTPERIAAAIDTHYALRQECLFQTQRGFPYETADTQEQGMLHVLAGAGLVSETARSEGLVRYGLTPAGIVATTRFCYGHRRAMAVTKLGGILKQGSLEIVEAQYRYKVDGLPGWAQSPDLQAAFPSLRAAANGTAEDHATLGWTPTGWRIPE